MDDNAIEDDASPMKKQRVEEMVIPYSNLSYFTDNFNLSYFKYLSSGDLNSGTVIGNIKK